MKVPIVIQSREVYILTSDGAKIGSGGLAGDLSSSASPKSVF